MLRTPLKLAGDIYQLTCNPRSAHISEGGGWLCGAARRGKGKNMAKGPNAALLQKLGLEGPRALAYGAPLSAPLPPPPPLTERILFSLHKTTSTKPPREQEWALKESTTCARKISSYNSLLQNERWRFAKTSFSVFSFEMPKVMPLLLKTTPGNLKT